MILVDGSVVWSFWGEYGYDYEGSPAQRQMLLDKANELGGIPIDSRTGAIVR
jgi:hypothetical protein